MKESMMERGKIIDGYVKVDDNKNVIEEKYLVRWEDGTESWVDESELEKVLLQ